MKTIVVRAYGGPEALELDETATPEPGAGELRIAVAAAAVNPVDAATRAGYFDSFVRGRLPVGLGWDLAGTVDALGADVSGFAVGDAVVALIDRVVGPSGAYASHAVVPVTAVAAAPRDVEPTAAATLPLNATTALQALDLLGLPAGASVLVTGAAGAVGEYLVRLASQRGLEVTGLARAADEDAVRASGASDFVTAPTGSYDGVLDPAQLVAPALAAVRDGGAFVAFTDPAAPAAERGVRVEKVSVHHDGAQLGWLVGEVEAGRLPLRVAGTYPLAEAAAAHARLEEGGLRGRLVLVP